MSSEESDSVSSKTDRTSADQPFKVLSMGCPYDRYPVSAWWKTAVAAPPRDRVEPLIQPPFRLSRTDRIATIGSCFAQEIARRLGPQGFRFFDAEPAPAFVDVEQARRWQYGVFSARYGNVYTSRQMLQLLQRAYGTFTPTDDVWPSAEGGWVDAFRPAVDPGGLASREEVIWSREGHLAAVRELFAGCDVLVFTLGLTEGWRAKCDGAVFPVCPGCGAGTFDPERYESFNLSCAEVTDDLREIHRQLKAVNPDLRLILTVSPVPLIATHSGRHVLVATTYSKSVLRVAADEFAEGREDVCYFPSYEIITGSHARGGYYWENLRTVRPEGVEHVMRCFFRSFADETVDPLPAVKSAETDRRAAAPLFAICDEEELQRRYERNRE